MLSIPTDIHPEQLPGPERDGWSYDEIIWSPCKTNFVLAYSIREISYGNPVGRFIWGTSNGQTSKILGRPEMSIFAPKRFSHWVSDEIFIVKTSYKNWRLGYFYPLIAFHISEGFCVIENSHNLDSEPDSVKNKDFRFIQFDEQSLKNALKSYRK